MIKKLKQILRKEDTYNYKKNIVKYHEKKYYSSEEPHPFKRTFKYILNHKALFFISFILSIVYTFINIIPPFVGQLAIAITGGKATDIFNKIPLLKEFEKFDAKVIFSNFINPENITNPTMLLQFSVVILLGFIYVIFRVALDYIKSFLFSFVSQDIGIDVRSDMLKSVLHTDIGFFKQEREGVILSRIGESSVIPSFLCGTLPALVTTPLTILLTFVVLLILNVKLTLICVTVAPLLAIGTNLISNFIKKRVSLQHELNANVGSVMQENIRGIEVIKIFSKEDEEVQKYTDIQKDTVDLGRKLMLASALNRPLTELIMISAMLIILGYGGYLIFKNEMPFEFLWGFLLYMLNISTPVRDLSGLFISIKSSEETLKRVYKIIDLPKENVDDKTKIKMCPIEKEISFEDVYFTYPKRLETENPFTLGPINLKVKKGSVIAFVGNSGGGKSTLISLIPKLFIQTKGSIYFDGINTSDINTKSLRESIGLVSQENILFYGSVKDNICFGDKNAKEKDIIEAAKIAYAHDFIMRLPKEYDTHIGPRGVMLSGGQRQRISLARSVLRKPSILILDEATSSLDTESEMYVQEALNNIIHLQTTFVIAHRLSTIKNANYICVIEDGKITEQGTHESLMMYNGRYKHLYSLQFRE